MPEATRSQQPKLRYKSLQVLIITLPGTPPPAFASGHVTNRFHISTEKALLSEPVSPPPHLSITTYYQHSPISDKQGLTGRLGTQVREAGSPD